MFDLKKFLQTVGLSLLISILISVAFGFFEFDNYAVYLTIQMLSFYGTVGFFAVVFNPRTPFTASYLGALIIAVLNILFANYVFGIWMFVNPAGINSSLSYAVITALSVTAITVFIKNKSERYADV